MKHLFALLLVALSFSAFSQRVVLTADEKAILQESTRFKNQVKWSLLAQAEYWKSGVNPTTIETSALCERWAKSRLFAASMVSVPSQAEGSEYVQHYLHFLKNDAVRLQAGEFNLDETIDYLISSGKFETCADRTFDLKISTIQF